MSTTPNLARDPLLLLSPHPDDVALSCAALVERDEPLDIATVFTGAPDPVQVTPWDRLCGFSDSNEAMAARMAEEHAAFDDTPHRIHDLGLLESQYLDRPRGPAIRVAIARFTTTWLRDAGPRARVVAPVGAGRRPLVSEWVGRRLGLGPAAHRDHIYVRDIALAAIHPGRALMYEEFPYREGRRGDLAARRAAHLFGCRPVALTVPVERDRKARRLMAYASQLAGLGMNPESAADRARLPTTERYYRLVRRRPAGGRRTRAALQRRP